MASLLWRICAILHHSICTAALEHQLLQLNMLNNFGVAPNMRIKITPITPALAEYVVQRHSHAEDAVLQEHRARTQQLGGVSEMLISPEQGTLLSILVAATGARNAVEVGTFTGYSAACIARGLPADGKLHCFDRSDEWTQIAREYWGRYGLQNKIELHLGDAAQTLTDWKSDAPIDFAFIDADKSGYDRYYELLLPLLKPNALILFDNTLRNGRVAEPNLTHPDDIAIDALNRKLAKDPRVESVLLPLADGLTVCRKIVA
ncbi:MAG TPA: class I SAM-dependent methyltransferase [Abditibacteriaceae bacterium]